MNDSLGQRGPYRLTMTVEFTGDQYPVLQLAGDVDSLLEQMGPVVARDAEGNPSRIDGKDEGRPVAISISTAEEYL